MRLVHKKTGACRGIVWLLVISSLACWEVAASRLQGCFLGNPDLNSCQPIDIYVLGHGRAMLASPHDNSYQSAQLLAFISRTIDIGVSRAGYAETGSKPVWQSHYDAPPTPPPDQSISSLFA